MSNKGTSYQPANFRILSIRQAQRILHVEDCLDIGKVRLDLYDYQRGNGARDHADFYVDTHIARLIAHDLAVNGCPAITDGLELQGGGSRNSEITARILKLERSDTKNPTRVTIASGPGVRLDSGLIAFQKGTKPARTAMLLSAADSHSLGLALLEHLQAWATVTYRDRVKNGVFHPRNPAGSDEPVLCPRCQTRPCACDLIEAGQRPATDTETGELLDGQDPILRYADGEPVSDNAAEVKAYQAYLTAERQIPPGVDALRQWVLDTAKKGT